MQTKIKVEVTIRGGNLTAEEYWNEIKALQELLGADVEIEIKEPCNGKAPVETNECKNMLTGSSALANLRQPDSASSYVEPLGDSKHGTYGKVKMKDL